MDGACDAYRMHKMHYKCTGSPRLDVCLLHVIYYSTQSTYVFRTNCYITINDSYSYWIVESSKLFFNLHSALFLVSIQCRNAHKTSTRDDTKLATHRGSLTIWRKDCRNRMMKTSIGINFDLFYQQHKNFQFNQTLVETNMGSLILKWTTILWKHARALLRHILYIYNVFSSSE